MDIRKLFRDGLLEYPQRNRNSLQIFCSSGNVNISRLESGVVNNRTLFCQTCTSTNGILKLKPWLQTVFLSPVTAFMMSAFSPGSTTQTQLLKRRRPRPPTVSNQLNLLAISNDYILIQMQEKYTKIVADYRLTNRLLGRGTFSDVLLGYARDCRKLAVKVIPRRQINESEMRNFESEVGLLRSIKHENIVELVDFKKSQNNFYLFLEYCEGGNLSEYIQEKKKLSQPEAVKIFAQILRGMSAMHQYKIVHRDLKPANILLKNGKAKITDFGLACKFSKDEMMQAFVGTPLHMAPQILKRKLYNEKVDIYSAGTILYQMLYGAVPFKGRDTKSLIEAIEMGKLSAQNEMVSESIRELLKNMLKAEPEERIDLKDVINYVSSYQSDKKQELLLKFKKQSQASADSLGTPGGIFCNFDLQNNSPRRASDMEMRLYSKLYRKLSPESVKA